MTSPNENDSEGNVNATKQRATSPSPKKKHVHLILEAERYKNFMTLKRVFKKNSDVDVLRMCIDEMYTYLTREKLELRPVLQQQASFLLQNEYLTDRYLVLTLNDVVNEAVHLWIRMKRAEINLHHTPFRQALPEPDQQVALVFAEKQFEYERGLTFDDLQEYLKGLNESKIREIVQKFLENKLLTTNHLDGVTYYYAPVP